MGVFAYMYACVALCAAPTNAQIGPQFPWSQITDGCKTHVGTLNQIQVFWKSNQCCYLLSCLSNPCLTC